MGFWPFGKKRVVEEKPKAKALSDKEGAVVVGQGESEPKPEASQMAHRDPEPEMTQVVHREKVEFPMAYRIAKSLELSPDEWSGEYLPYTLVHIHSGYRLWIANEEYRMGERVKDSRGGAYTIHFSEEEASIIWPHAKRTIHYLANRRAEKLFHRPEKVRIWQYSTTSHWLCKSIGSPVPWVGAGATPNEAYRAFLASAYPECRTPLLGDRPIIVQKG